MYRVYEDFGKRRLNGSVKKISPQLRSTGEEACGWPEAEVTMMSYDQTMKYPLATRL